MPRPRSVTQRGSVLVSAIALLGIAVAIGIAVTIFSTGEQQSAARERTREASFDLAESALYATGIELGRAWPVSSTTAFPANCGPGSTAAGCPNAAAIASTFDTTDYDTPLDWTVTVRDDGAGTGSYYTPAVLSQPRYDANANGAVWLYARATVRGRPVAVVAQYKLAEVSAAFPRNSVTAGYFKTSNNGDKVIVDTQGNAGQAAPIAVRCDNANSPACLDYRDGQVVPPVFTLGYSGGNAISADALNGLKLAAKLAGTYHATCPANPSGRIVYVESGDCSYDNSVPGPCCNTEASPGLFIIANGTFFMNGNINFYGTVYAANHQNSSGIVVATLGTGKFWGAVVIDGLGGYSAGASKDNFEYGDGARGFLSYGAPEIVKNTWRQVPGM